MNISHRIKLGEANIRQIRGSAYNATATHTHARAYMCVLSVSGDYGGIFTYRKVKGTEMSLFFVLKFGTSSANPPCSSSGVSSFVMMDEVIRTIIMT